MIEIIAYAISLFIIFKVARRIHRHFKLKKFESYCTKHGVVGDPVEYMTKNIELIEEKVLHIGKNPKYDDMSHEEMVAVAMKNLQSEKSRS